MKRAPVLALAIDRILRIKLLEAELAKLREYEAELVDFLNHYYRTTVVNTAK